MKNLQTKLAKTENGKWGQTPARAIKAEVEQALRAHFTGMELDVFEADKGFNVELFDANGVAFVVNINPTVKQADFDVLEHQEIVNLERKQKLENEKERKLKSEAKKLKDKEKREAKKKAVK